MNLGLQFFSTASEEFTAAGFFQLSFVKRLLRARAEINSHFGASAGRADARRRDEGDVGHRRGAATKPIRALRRRASAGCGPQARWLCCSLLTYRPGYSSSLAPRQRAWGPAAKCEFISARALSTQAINTATHKPPALQCGRTGGSAIVQASENRSCALFLLRQAGRGAGRGVLELRPPQSRNVGILPGAAQAGQRFRFCFACDLGMGAGLCWGGYHGSERQRRA